MPDDQPPHSDATTPHCHVCDAIAGAAAEETIFADELWSANIAGGVPGWLRLQTKRHGDWSWDLTPDEAATFGPTLSRLSSAVRTASGAETVYIIALGENSRHFHVLLIPRLADAPADLRGPGVLAKAQELVDLTEATRIASLIRGELASS